MPCFLLVTGEYVFPVVNILLRETEAPVLHVSYHIVTGNMGRIHR